jgi:hypothetical protein
MHLRSAPTLKSNDLNVQGVTIFFTLKGYFGRKDERRAIYELEHELERLANEAGVGEMDGHEFGNRKGEIYLYGPDAKRLFNAVRPALEAFDMKPIDVVLTHGDVTDASSPMEKKRID